MNPKLCAIILITVVFIVILQVHSENFASKQSKAQAIFDWFKKNNKPSYTNYRSDLNMNSNIVEYEDVLSLLQNNNLSVESIKKVI